MEENLSVTNFREYLKIKSVQPHPDYESCVSWLKKQAIELEAEFFLTECSAGKPVVVITVPGRNPTLPSILLNSHTDVVPVFEEFWKYDPFSAYKDEEGNIYGRGSQDMKSVGVQYIEAMKKLKSKGIALLRTVHMSFVPDEEIGGEDGMKKFVQTEHFKKLKVGFALDEGYASQDETFFVFYGERNSWQFWVHCKGTPGHGSQFVPNTAGVKLRRVIDSFMTFRDEEEEKLKLDPSLTLGDVTSVNLTLLEGGVQVNVVPAELHVGFDIRVSPTVDLKEFEKRIRGWCEAAGDDVDIEFTAKGTGVGVTNVTDGENSFWDAFRTACDREDIRLKKEIFPAATDSRYIRACGIPALGFSPMNQTPLLLHSHNEFLNETVFLRGIELYESIIKAIANVEQ